MIVGFTTTCAIGAYHQWSCEFESYSCRGVRNTTLGDKVCQWLSTGQWFYPGTPVSSTNKTECHDISEILLKVGSNTITITLPKHMSSIGPFILKTSSYYRHIPSHILA